MANGFRNAFLLILLFSSAFSQSFVFLSGYQASISAYDFNSGSLTVATTTTVRGSPSFLAFHPKMNVLYAVDETTPGTVSAYTIESNGGLTKLNTLTSGGNVPAHVSVHPSGNWVYTSNYGDGFISVASVGADGSLGAQIFSEFAGQNAHMAMTDPLGKYLFVVCKGSDYIVQYLIGPDGRLTRNAPATVPTANGAGPRHLAFHPTKNVVYVATELSNSIITHTYNPNTGTLTALQTISSLPATFAGYSTGAEIQVSTDGQFVYASNRGHNSIGSWAIRADGTLTPLTWETGGGDINTPRHFSLDPTGAYMFVANQGSNTVTLFTVNKSTGALTKVRTTAVTQQPSFVSTWRASTETTTEESSGACVSLLQSVIFVIILLGIL